MFEIQKRTASHSYEKTFKFFMVLSFLLRFFWNHLNDRSARFEKHSCGIVFDVVDVVRFLTLDGFRIPQHSGNRLKNRLAKTGTDLTALDLFGPLS